MTLQEMVKSLIDYYPQFGLNGNRPKTVRRVDDETLFFYTERKIQYEYNCKKHALVSLHPREYGTHKKLAPMDEQKWRENLSRNITRIMRLRKISIKALVLDADVSSTALRSWLDCERTPSAYSVSKLARALNVSSGELIDVHE